MIPYLSIQKLALSYGDKTILQQLELQLNRGQIAAICGLNGSGKSSFFRILAGLEKNAVGEIYIEGSDITMLNVWQRSNLISLITTERPRLQGLDVITIVEMAAHGHIGKQEMASHLNRCLDLAGATHLANRPLNQLSDGELQKVMMARALAQNTVIIIADEPTAFLDYKAKKEMMQTMRNLAHSENKLILFSSHDLELVQEFADIRYELANGKLKLISPGQLI